MRATAFDRRPSLIPHYSLARPKFRYETRQGKLYRIYLDGSSSVVGQEHDPLRGARVVAAMEVLGVRWDTNSTGAEVWRVLVVVTQLDIWADGKSCPLPRMHLVRKLLLCEEPKDLKRLRSIANATERELETKLLPLLNDLGRMDSADRRAAGRRVTEVRSR